MTVDLVLYQPDIAQNTGTLLRLGPAPYVRDDQLREAIRLLGEVYGFGNR